METVKLLTAEEKKVAKGFCQYIYSTPVGDLIRLKGLQNVLSIAKGRPGDYTYAVHLRVATEMGWIEPVEGRPDTYKRIQYLPPMLQTSPYVRKQMRVLADKIICELEGRSWTD